MSEERLTKDDITETWNDLHHANISQEWIDGVLRMQQTSVLIDIRDELAALREIGRDVVHELRDTRLSIGEIG